MMRNILTTESLALQGVEEVSFLFIFLSFNKPKFGLLAGILIPLLFLFLSFSKMHSPEYLTGYWVLLASAMILLISFIINRMNRKAY